LSARQALARRQLARGDSNTDTLLNGEPSYPLNDMPSRVPGWCRTSLLRAVDAALSR